MPDLAYIQSAWFELTRNYGADEGLSGQLFAALKEAYTGPGRFYHNLDHIESLLKLSQDHADQLGNRDVVGFSIFYHDFVYHAGGRDNEQQSALVAEKSLTTLGVEKGQREQVKLFICATANHGHLPNADEDLRLFIDFDLSILAADQEVYQHYVRNIRKEYSHIPSDQFALGRKGFITGLLRQEHIFYTESFREKEEQARKNMAWELEMSSYIFPGG